MLPICFVFDLCPGSTGMIEFHGNIIILFFLELCLNSVGTVGHFWELLTVVCHVSKVVSFYCMNQTRRIKQSNNQFFCRQYTNTCIKLF